MPALILSTICNLFAADLTLLTGKVNMVYFSRKQRLWYGDFEAQSFIALCMQLFYLGCDMIGSPDWAKLVNLCTITTQLTYTANLVRCQSASRLLVFLPHYK
jgi:hypothetical protein